MAIKLGTKPIELGEDSAVVEELIPEEVALAALDALPKKPVFTVEELRFMLEQKLLEQAKTAEETGERVKPPAKAPSGMLWVFNRGPQKFEWQYDGTVYEVEGHDMACYPERIARHGRKRSLVSLDPFSNKAVFRLAVEDEEKFGVPLRVVNRTELMDRSVASNFLDGSSPVRTTPKAIRVDGVAEMLARRQDTYVELE